MKRTITVTFLLALPVILAAQKIQSETMQFGVYHNYQWLPGRVLTKGGITNDPEIDAIVKKAVTAQLNARSLSEVADSADLQFTFFAGAQANIRINDLLAGTYATLNIGGYGGMDTQVYAKTSLILNCISVATKNSVWGAIATDNFSKPNEREQRINQAVAKAFQKFPMKAPKS